MTNPYSSLGPDKFWRTAVADRHFFDIEDIWTPKFSLTPDDKVITFGSCFAQHIGKALQANGYCWHVTERPPSGLPNPEKFGYNVFSSRTANIYTTSLLLQWAKWALSGEQPPEEAWEQSGRFYDPFRPKIENNGFASLDELMKSRAQAIRSFGEALTSANTFVFTLGLTESWLNQAGGYEYPMCPGTAAGTFNPSLHKFVNQDFATILENLRAAVALIRAANPKIRFIFTVSPVPLTATYTGRHVVVATMESKSVLRAVAGQITSDDDGMDYFPSYEIINSPVFKGIFFEPNQRNVSPHGVQFVMKNFFQCMQKRAGQTNAANTASGARSAEVCEEELLAAFAGDQK